MLRQPKTRKSKAMTPEHEDYFNRFWPHYPRKDQKEDAKKALVQMWSKLPTIDALILATNAYEASRKGKGPEHTKLPGGWLRGQMWEDQSLKRFMVEERVFTPKIVNMWEEKIKDLERQEQAMTELGTEKSLKIAGEIRAEIESLTKKKVGNL